ncbi:MAG: hypothetical protein PHR43_06220 [Dehalococcoidales bacterium]|nr:hypothetical protein [Dehalococcoidales bacterium]
MMKWEKYLLLLAAIILIGNSLVIRIYGDVIRSSHLFIASPAVFYPLATFNLITGIIILLLLIRDIWQSHHKR